MKKSIKNNDFKIAGLGFLMLIVGIIIGFLLNIGIELNNNADLYCKNIYGEHSGGSYYVDDTSFNESTEIYKCWYFTEDELGRWRQIHYKEYLKP